MATGVTVYCDGHPSHAPCAQQHPTRYGRIPWARGDARTHGWTRRAGIDLCPTCSEREYGPHRKAHRR